MKTIYWILGLFTMILILVGFFFINIFYNDITGSICVSDSMCEVETSECKYVAKNFLHIDFGAILACSTSYQGNLEIKKENLSAHCEQFTCNLKLK